MKELWRVFIASMSPSSDVSSKRVTAYQLTGILALIVVSGVPLKIYLGYDYPTEVTLAILAAILGLHGVGAWQDTKNAKTEAVKDTEIKIHD